MQARSTLLVALALVALAGCSSDDGDARDTRDAAEVAPDTIEDVPVEIDAAEDVPAEIDVAEDVPVEIDAAEDVPAEIDAVEDVPAEIDAVEDVPVDIDVPEDVPAEIETIEDVADTTADSDTSEPTSPYFGALIFNEILCDGATDGDPNGDGDVDPVDDEFVEIANVSDAAIDLGGFVLRESTLPDLPRHTFAPGDTLGPGNTLVIFGGGAAPDDLPGARFVVANAEDPGIPFGLSLDNDGDVLELVDDNGDVVATFAWGPDADLPALPALADESYTRAPDLTGAFVPHTTAAPATIFSPGLRADGSTFK